MLSAHYETEGQGVSEAGPLFYPPTHTHAVCLFTASPAQSWGQRPVKHNAVFTRGSYVPMRETDNDKSGGRAVMQVKNAMLCVTDPHGKVPGSSLKTSLAMCVLMIWGSPRLGVDLSVLSLCLCSLSLMKIRNKQTGGKTGKSADKNTPQLRSEENPCATFQRGQNISKRLTFIRLKSAPGPSQHSAQNTVADLRVLQRTGRKFAARAN